MLRPKVVLVSEELYEVPKGNGQAGPGVGGSRDNQQSFFSSVLAVIDQSQSQTVEPPEAQTQSTQGQDTQSQTTPPEPSPVAAAVDDGGGAAVTTPPMFDMDAEADAPSQATSPVTASPAPAGTPPPDDAGADHAMPPTHPDADDRPVDAVTNDEHTQPREVDTSTEARVQAVTPTAPAPSRAEDAPRDPSSSKSRTPDIGRKWPEVNTNMLPPPEPRQVTASASTSPATPLQTVGGRAVKEDGCAAPFELDPLRQDWVETPMAADDGHAEGALPWETLDVPVQMTEAGQQSPTRAAAPAARTAPPKASKSPQSAPQSPAAKKATPTRRPIERLDLDPAAGTKRRMPDEEPPRESKRAKAAAELPPPFDASLVTMTNIEEAMRWCATNGRPNHALMDTLFGEIHGPKCWKAVGDSQRFRTAVLGFLATDAVDLKDPQGGGAAVVRPLAAWVEAALQHCAPPDVLHSFTTTPKSCARCRFKWCRHYMQHCNLALCDAPEGNPFIPSAFWNVRDDFAVLRGAHSASCSAVAGTKSARRRQQATARPQS